MTTKKYSPIHIRTVKTNGIPTITPLLVNLSGKEIPVMVAYGPQDNEYRVVSYPTLEQVGLFQREEISVIGKITSLL